MPRIKHKESQPNQPCNQVAQQQLPMKQENVNRDGHDRNRIGRPDEIPPGQQRRQQQREEGVEI